MTPRESEIKATVFKWIQQNINSDFKKAIPNTLAERCGIFMANWADSNPDQTTGIRIILKHFEENGRVSEESIMTLHSNKIQSLTAALDVAEKTLTEIQDINKARDPHASHISIWSIAEEALSEIARIKEETKG